MRVKWIWADAVTFNSAAIDLGENFAPAPEQPMRIILNVETLDAADADETYQFEMKESDDGVTYVSTGLVFSVAATGTTTKIFGVTKRYQRLTGTLAGTTPSVKLSAWLGRV